MLLRESNAKILFFDKLGLRIFGNEKAIQTTDCKAGGSVMCLCITTFAVFCLKCIGNQPLDMFGCWRKEEILIIF